MKCTTFCVFWTANNEDVQKLQACISGFIACFLLELNEYFLLASIDGQINVRGSNAPPLYLQGFNPHFFNPFVCAEECELALSTCNPSWVPARVWLLALKTPSSLKFFSFYFQKWRFPSIRKKNSMSIFVIASSIFIGDMGFLLFFNFKKTLILFSAILSYTKIKMIG